MDINTMIRDVQRSLGVTVDGRAGPETWGAIHLALVQGRRATRAEPPTVSRVDPRSERNIASLLPEVRPLARALVQKAAQLGANNVLAKPFTIDKMRAAIEAVFGSLK